MVSSGVDLNIKRNLFSAKINAIVKSVYERNMKVPTFKLYLPFHQLLYYMISFISLLHGTGAMLLVRSIHLL